LSHNEKIAAIENGHPILSVTRQAALLDISRGSLYYTPKEREADKRHMDMIDNIYTDLPFYGSRRIRNELCDRFGEQVCRERVQRLMRLMGIEAIYPKPNTSRACPEHKKYPYLLTGISASFPNHIWGTDITYVKLETGWAYLTALLDWFSRYVISWELSPSLETDFCVTALTHALDNALPKIHNSDQGTQFTSTEYTGILTDHNIRISMDGRGRCMDNIFTERLWRSVKRENIYLKSYRDIVEARDGLTEYFTFYNEKRRHQSLEYRTPYEVYFGG
jgi:putative transposase